jgi:hypothetical protein
MNEQHTLVYYTAQAANRRHFQVLFFAVTGFTWSFSLAAFAVLEAQMTGLGVLASGLVLLGGSFIALRLLRRERAAFNAMMTAWRGIAQEEMITKAATVRPGAMAVACGLQGVIGCGVIGLLFFY